MPELLTDPPATAPVATPTAGSAPPPPVAPTPTAPVAPAPPAAWHAQLPDDVKALPNFKSLEKFKDPQSLAKSYLHMEHLQGRSVAIPGQDATPEERAAFYQKLGVPEAPDKYTIAAPEGVPLDPGAVGQWQKTFHRLNLTPDQVAGLTSEFFGSPMGNPQIVADKLHAEAVASLKAEWGGNYDNNLKLAQQAVRQLGGADVVNVLNQSGLASHPAFVKMFQRLGKDYAEDGMIVTDAQGVVGPEEAAQKIAAIYADKEHPYHGKQGRAAQEAAREEMHRLFQVKAQIS